MQPLPSFSKEEFLKQASNFAEWVSKQKLNRKSWKNNLCDFYWSRAKQNWEEGIQARNDFFIQLSEVKPQSFGKIATKIVNEFGGIQQPYETDYREALDFLNNSQSETSYETWKQNLIATRIASTTKIYAMSNPSLWTIYDSRVAVGIARLMDENGLFSKKDYVNHPCLSFRLPLNKGKKCRKVNGFKSLGYGAVDQALLSFIYASWLLQEIAIRVQENYGNPPIPNINNQMINVNTWQVYHIEMVLFMYGK